MTACRLTIRVTPNAGRDEVRAVGPDRVEIRLRAPAVEGQANAALIRFLADRLDLRPGAIQIERGATSRVKIIAIDGLAADAARARLAG